MSVKRFYENTSSKSCQMWFHARSLATRVSCVPLPPGGSFVHTIYAITFHHPHIIMVV